jgi:hypothetical protein
MHVSGHTLLHVRRRGVERRQDCSQSLRSTNSTNNLSGSGMRAKKYNQSIPYSGSRCRPYDACQLELEIFEKRASTATARDGVVYLQRKTQDHGHCLPPSYAFPVFIDHRRHHEGATVPRVLVVAMRHTVCQRQPPFTPDSESLTNKIILRL